MGRRTVLLIAAIVVAALGTTLVYFYVDRTDERAQRKNDPVEVLVAKTLIKAGTTGAEAERSGAFQLQTVPRSVAIAGVLRETRAIGDLVAVADIFPGEQIIAAKFAVAGTAGALPIPPGKVAMSVQLGDPQRVAGFVQPGSDVAVFVSIADAGGAPGQRGETTTRLLLPRVPVIAVGPTTLRRFGRGEANNEEVPTAILSLAVDQLQAQKLIYASQNGQLYFALLTKDSKVTPGPGVGAGNLFS